MKCNNNNNKWKEIPHENQMDNLNSIFENVLFSNLLIYLFIIYNMQMQAYLLSITVGS